MEIYLQNVHDFCNCLKILINNVTDIVAPQDVEAKAHEKPQRDIDIIIESTLQKQITRLLQEIDKYPLVNEHVMNLAPFLKDVEFCQRSITWSFVLWCSVLLLGVKSQLDLAKVEKLAKNSVEIDQLSVGDQQIFISSVQFIIRMGICPNLIPGVDVRGNLNSNIAKENLTYYESYRRLVFSLVTLLLITNHPQLKALVVTKHLIDLLASLAQICHAPIKKYGKDIPNIDLSEQELRKNVLRDVLSQFSEENFKNLLLIYSSKYDGSEYELISEMEMDRIEFKPVFEHLQKSVLQSILVRDLLNLQKLSKTRWLKLLCGELLSTALLRKNGVRAIIDALLPNMFDLTNNQASNSDFLKIEKIANIISQPSNQCQSIETYYAKICPQVIDLLSNAEFSTDHVITKICCSVINNLTEKNLSRFAIKPFTKNLSKIVKLKTTEEVKKIKTGIVIEEKELEKIIVIFSKLLSSNLEINDLLKKDLQQFAYFFFKLYVEIHAGALNIKNQVKDLLLFWLNNSENPISFLNCISFDEFGCGILPLSENVRFIYGDEGGIRVELVENSSANDPHQLLIENDQKQSAIYIILDDYDKEDIIQEWFMILLEKFSSVMEISKDSTDFEIRHNLHLMFLIQHLSEKYGLDLIKSSTKAIAFVRNTLKRNIKIKSDYTLTNLDISFADQSTFMALSILMSVVAQKDSMTTLEWKELKSCCTLLKKIKVQHPQSLIAKLAKDICVMIKADSKLKPNSKDGGKDRESLSPFARAWINLQDPLVPVVGNALITLKNLILEKDPEALAKKSTLFSVFEEQLDHEDSYIYLTAIRALTALALTYTDEILPKLASRYADYQSRRNDSIEFRLKLGEALVQICKNLGDMAPKYRNILLNSFLSTCKHSDDAHLKCSTLSNLGEICKLLKFSLGNNIQEILMCVSSLSSDTNVEIRRSSCMVLTLLLRGISSDTFVTIENDLLQVYRHLKKVYLLEKDDITKLHAQEALEEINRVVKSVLMPDVGLKKEIRILGLD